MERGSLAFLTLLGFAIGFRTDKPVIGIVLGALHGERFVVEILFGSILRVSWSKFILFMAFETLNEVHELPDSFVLHLLELFNSN
jgi:hypothetical protein